MKKKSIRQMNLDKIEKWYSIGFLLDGGGIIGHAKLHGTDFGDVERRFRKKFKVDNDCVLSSVTFIGSYINGRFYKPTENFE